MIKNRFAAHLRHRLSRFARDEDGMAVLAEFVIYFPLLVWAWIALFAFWDAYREVNVSQKAAYAISDIMSREQTPVSDAYRDGLSKVFAYLVGVPESDVKLRFTSVLYSIDDKTTGAGSYKMHWSYSPGSKLPELTTAKLKTDFTGNLPIMSDGDYVVMVETMREYDPAIKLPLLTTREITDIIITRPRFMRVCETGQSCS